MDSMALIRIEALSARISALLDARPETGAAWRRILAISEAAASLGMEDTPVPEHDLLLPAIGAQITNLNPHGTHVARMAMNAMLRPGALKANPAEVFERAMRAGRLLETINVDGEIKISYANAAEEIELQAARDEYAKAASMILRHEAPIIFRVLCLAEMTRHIIPEPSPIAERILFMAAEHEMRKQDCLSTRLLGRAGGDQDLRVQAHWTLTPSLALSHGGFRAWSPLQGSGRDQLVNRLETSLKTNIGMISSLHRWQEEVAAFSGKTRKSRRSDLGELITQMPIINSELVQRDLQITDRSARDLIQEAEQAGLLTLVTYRRTYRIWAVPALARLIKDKPGAAASKAGRKSAKARLDLLQSQERATEDPSQRAQRLQAAYATLDDAIRRADHVLAKERKNLVDHLTHKLDEER